MEWIDCGSEWLWVHAMVWMNDHKLLYSISSTWKSTCLNEPHPRWVIQAQKKKPGGLSFFQWIGGFVDLSSMGSFFLGICRLFQILYFSTKENLIFIEIGWGKKIKKSILGMDSNWAQAIAFNSFFPHNLLSLKHFCFYSFIFLVFFVLCEVCSSFSFFFQKSTKLLSASLLLLPSFKASSSSSRLLSPSAGFSHRLWRPQ